MRMRGTNCFLKFYLNKFPKFRIAPKPLPSFSLCPLFIRTGSPSFNALLLPAIIIDIRIRIRFPEGGL